MIHINLIPLREIRRAGRQRAQRAWGLVAVALTVISLITLSWREWSIESELAWQLATLRAAVTSGKSRPAGAERLQKELNAHREKLSVLAAIGRTGMPHEKVLRSVAAALPDTLWLARFAMTEGTLTLEGRATDHAGIAEFLQRLEALSQLADSELVEVHRPNEAREHGVEHFSIESRIGNRLADGNHRGTKP